MEPINASISFYEVKCDVDAFQYFLVEDEWPEVDDRPIVFDGRPWRAHWRSPSVFSFQPRLPEGDFWGILGGGGASLCVRPEALAHGHLESFLNPAGELLPVVYGERTFSLLNVTACFDSLDRERTIYREEVEFDEYELAEMDEREREYLESTPAVPDVQIPRFRLDRLGWQLFKVPETAITDIYYWEQSEDGPDEQLRRYCERERLTGLTFDLIYTTDVP